MRCGALMHGDTATSRPIDRQPQRALRMLVCNSHTHARPAFGDTPCNTPTCDASNAVRTVLVHGHGAARWLTALTAHGTAHGSTFTVQSIALSVSSLR